MAYFDPVSGEPFDPEEYYNPWSGPPDGEDAWLAQVASPVADAYLNARQPLPGAPGPREALAAGFTHKDHVPGARGFAAGGLLDVMQPGPVLTGFAGDAVDEGLASLSDDELIGLMGAARRLASRAAGIELAAVARLDAVRAADARAAGDWRQHAHVADEIAVSLTLTCRAADRLLDQANGTARLPAVTAALAAGRIDLPKATVYVRELAGLGDVAAAAIAAVTITDAPHLTTSELGEVLRRAVLAHDPAAARKRRKKAEQNARVETWTEDAGTMALAGRDLPPADTLAADANIDGRARQLKAAGAPGTLEYLRSRVFAALLAERPMYTLLPGFDTHGSPGGPHGGGGGGPDDDPSDGNDGGGNDGGTGTGGSPSGGPPGTGHAPDDDPGDGNGGGGTRGPGTGGPPSGGQPGTGGGPPLPAGLGGSVNLTIGLSTWLGLSSSPGETAGHWPIDPDTSRGCAALVARRPGGQWCPIITSQNGAAIGHARTRTRAGPGPLGRRQRMLMRSAAAHERLARPDRPLARAGPTASPAGPRARPTGLAAAPGRR